jgi:hypothetical protein
MDPSFKFGTYYIVITPYFVQTVEQVTQIRVRKLSMLKGGERRGGRGKEGRKRFGYALQIQVLNLVQTGEQVTQIRVWRREEGGKRFEGRGEG